MNNILVDLAFSSKEHEIVEDRNKETRSGYKMGFFIIQCEQHI